MPNLRFKHTGLAVFSGLLLSLPWLVLGFGWSVLIGFIPLLIIADDLSQSKKRNSTIKFTGYSFISMFIWNAASLWWLINASIISAIAVIIVYSLLMTIVFVWFFKTYKWIGRNSATILFIPLWISFEYIMMQTQISRPWQNLGNAFASNIMFVQWYEYTGIFGGSLWVLITNIFVFLIYIASTKHKFTKNKTIKFALASILIIVPVIFSISRYKTYNEKPNSIRIAIIQPNIDSYKEKYSMPIRDQLNIITTLASKAKDFNPDYFVAPETSIPIGVREAGISDHFTINIIRNFLQGNPDAAFVIGATTKLIYPKGKGKTIISQALGDSGDYYDLFNSALQIDTSNDVDIYHKSKLVPGVEFLPYPEILGRLERIVPKFGGLPGSHGTQSYREVFTHGTKGYKAGVPVCYESVYGDCVSEFVLCNAEILLIITNDGWWGNTQGYRQHNSLSSLRAIETRRSIARSANTGISCFINQRGDIISSLGYNERGILAGEINANDGLTFYVKHGDYIARILTAISLIINLLIIGVILKRRFSSR